ncbi:MAG: hypothetical protein HYY16_13010 [Planctomycetes bacterium]|nr:hypothetical protein [Planctomycetota bacterium]
MAIILMTLVGGMRFPLERELPVHSFLPTQPVSDALDAQNRWMIQVRWVVSAIAVMGFILCTTLWNVLPATPTEHLVAVTICIPAGNALFGLWSRKAVSKTTLLRTQMAFDVAVFTAFLHLTGGIDSPLLLLGVLHPVLAGIILSRRDAFGAALLVPSLVGLLELTQSVELLPLYPAPALPRQMTTPLALAVVLLSLAYFTTTIIRQLRRREAPLVQAGKMAAVGELAGTVAHEINNPVAIISSKLQALLHDSTSIPPSLTRELEKMDKHVHRIADITHGLLKYAHPSHGCKEPVDLNRVVQESVELVRGRLRDGPARLEMAPSEPLPEVLANFNDLSQVTLNLINNALDAMPDGGTLRIRTARRNGHVELEVSDTGCGMSPEVRAQIFDPFFTTKAESKGTGLGLAICLGLVRSHDGAIEVETQPGAGSCFRVLLPALKKEVAW